MHLRTIRLANIRQVRVCTDLPAPHRGRILALFDEVGWLVGDDFERFYQSFLCDMDVEVELAVWDRVNQAYHAFFKKRSSPLAERVAALRVLLHLSTDTLPDGKPHPDLIELRNCFAAAEERVAVA